MTDRRSPRRTTDPANWYETPVFEADPDERLEARATSGRGPMRLAAAARLRVDARRAGLRHGQSAAPVATQVEVKSEVAARGRSLAPSPEGPKVAARAAQTEQLAADEVAWQRWCRSDPDNGPADSLAQLDLDRRLHAGLRGRIGGHLDHWAEREVAVWQRIERSLFLRTPPPQESLE
jgi:hypothetical protein